MIKCILKKIWAKRKSQDGGSSVCDYTTTTTTMILHGWGLLITGESSEVRAFYCKGFWFCSGLNARPSNCYLASCRRLRPSQYNYYESGWTCCPRPLRCEVTSHPQSRSLLKMTTNLATYSCSNARWALSLFDGLKTSSRFTKSAASRGAHDSIETRVAPPEFETACSLIKEEP